MRTLFTQLSKAVERLKRQIPYLLPAFQLVYHATGAYIFLWLALLMTQGILPVATVYLTKHLVDGIARVLATGGGWASMTALLPAALAMAAVLISTEVMQGLGKWLRAAQSEKVQDYIHKLIHDQAIRLDLSFYDNPRFYDQLHRARIDAITQPIALLENTGMLFQSLITLIAMAGVLLSFGIWIPLLLAFSSLPALAVVLQHTVRYHQWRLRNTETMRRTHYYDMMLTQREAAAEMRLFGLGPYFELLFQNLRKRLRREKTDLARSEAATHFLATLIGLASMAGALIWLALRAAQGAVGLGDLALFYQAFLQGQRMMRSLLGSTGEIYKNIMFLENLFEFLALQPRLHEPDNPLPHPGLKTGISLHGITFSYPGTMRHALEDFHLAIPAGRITAIVGENGAGKTTLIKLLCRLYDPQQGRILIDGTDIRTLSLAELRNGITVLFQEPVRYHDTVFNNIAFGNIHNKPEISQVEAAAKASGADAPISRLPRGYEAILGKWFGGAELSGGEWQRLALARAFLRKADLIILDEPTSAMDSWAEADWLQRFRTLVAGRTALIITHRFTTALQADIIHVMESGRVIESGAHDELVEAQGRYAVSWTRQMRGKDIKQATD